MADVSDEDAQEENKKSVLPTGEKLYTTEEVKNIFKVSSDTTINSWIRKELLKPIKIAQKNYFKKDDIEKLLDEKAMK